MRLKNKTPNPEKEEEKKGLNQKIKHAQKTHSKEKAKKKDDKQEKS